MEPLTHDNDDETFQPLGLHALRLLVKLSEKQEKQRERDAQREREDKEKAEQHRRAVDQGLRDIASFEERAAGKLVRIRRKRN